MVNLHSAETLAERSEVLARHGKTPIRLLRDLGFLDGRTLLAHCVHVDNEEIGLLAGGSAGGGAAVSHNPMSNLKLASGIAPLAKMAEAGVRLSLGTDGALSGNDLDMWLAMRLCAVLQKCENRDATLFKAETVVRMATIEAARAIGLGDKIGSLEAGKRADIILIDLDSPHLTPLYDIYAQLLYAVGREDVATVLIDGRIVMRDRKSTTIDYRESIDTLKALSAKA
jgi:5-methylthioadenosine/S-adenosylhomocysteine deaminase